MPHNSPTIRDDAEWLHNRKIMNGLMLNADSQQPVRDAIRRSCDDLVAELRALLPTGQSSAGTPPVEVPDLVGALYAWSVRGVAAVVLGDQANDRRLHGLIGELAAQLHRLFADSAPLMSFPPRLAQRLRLRIWTDFERTVGEILGVANDIAGIALERMRADGRLEDGSACLMAGMVQSGMPDEMIKRIFVDLIVAAGDTVRGRL